MFANNGKHYSNTSTLSSCEIRNLKILGPDMIMSHIYSILNSNIYYVYKVI